MLSDIDARIKSATTGFNFDYDVNNPMDSKDNQGSSENAELSTFKSKLNRFPYLSKPKNIDPIPIDEDDSDDDGEEVKLVITFMFDIHFQLMYWYY